MMIIGITVKLSFIIKKRLKILVITNARATATTAKICVIKNDIRYFHH